MMFRSPVLSEVYMTTMEILDMFFIEENEEIQQLRLRNGQGYEPPTIVSCRVSGETRDDRTLCLLFRSTHPHARVVTRDGRLKTHTPALSLFQFSF